MFLKIVPIALLLSSTIFQSASEAFAQAPVPIDRIEQAVRLHSSIPPEPNVQLLIAMVPELRQDVVSIQMSEESFHSRRVSLIDFYLVTPGLYRLNGDKVEALTIDLGDDPAWLVAFGPNDTTYLLDGFDDPKLGFNKLIQSLTLSISDKIAWDIFDLYLKMVHDQSFRGSVVADDMGLQSRALADFRLRFPTSTRKHEFNKWWNRLSVPIKHELALPKMTYVSDGREITYFRYDAGRILKESVQINPLCEVTKAMSVVLYR